MRQLSAIVVKNSVFSLLGQVLIKVLSFCFSVFVVRRLGDASFGKYSTALAYVGVYAIFSDLGLAPYMVREVAKDNDEASFMFFNVAALRLILSACTFALIIGSAILLKRSPGLILGAAVASGGLFLYAIEGPLESLLMAKERLDYLSAVNVLNQLAFVALGTFVLVGGYGFVGLLAASLCSLSAATVVGLVILYRRLGGLHWQLDPARWLPLLRAALPFGLIGFALGLSYKASTVLLQYFHGDGATGWYNVAYNLIFMLMMISHAVNLALYPSMCRQYATNPQAMPKLYERALKYLFLFSIPIAAGTTILSDKIIYFLYTEEFAPSILPLRILIWVLPLMFLTELLGNMVVVHDQEKKVVRALMTSTAISVVLNLLLIPRFGLLGASIVTVVTEMVLAAQYLWLLRKELSAMSYTVVFLKPALAATAMGAVLLALRNLHLFILVGLGATVYLGGLILFGSVGGQEMTFLMNFLRRRAAA